MQREPCGTICHVKDVAAEVRAVLQRTEQRVVCATVYVRADDSRRQVVADERKGAARLVEEVDAIRILTERAAADANRAVVVGV